MHIDYDNPKDDDQNTLLLMPAVQCGDVAGVKIVNVAPSNHKINLPSIQGVYYLLNAITGYPKAIMDAKALTNWRTAASSALAAEYLALKEASSLLMVGAGALAPYIIDAYSAIRNLNHLMIYDIIKEKAQAIARHKNNQFAKITIVEDLEEASPHADIISVATLSKTPVIKGSWLRPGQHIDLIGSFKPNMREADNDVLRKSKIYVDSIEMAPKESGDLVIPLSERIISISDIQGDLFQLCQGKTKGRITEDEITLFKSVGHALEDLVAAQLVLTKNK
jgi:ornithine cyclodeaminase